jgi:hypothetical protein
MAPTRHIVCILLSCAVLLAGPAHALTFDEDFADNFTEITVEDIKFTADPAGFADFGTGFWFGADFVSGAALEVSQGASVIIDLPAPASFLQFGAAVGEEGGVLTDLATILAYDGTGLQVFPVSIEEPLFGGLGDAERRFSFLGGGVRKVVVSYEQSFGFSVLAVDNLVYQPIPEPATWMLVLAGSALVIARRARRVFDA